MKLSKIIAIVATLLCCGYSFAQQTATVTGKVVNDSTQKPLQSASIVVVGLKRGVQTDAQGNFTVKIPDDNKPHKLLISVVGYASKEVTVTGSSNITVKLKEDIKDEGEIVVQTGYGGGIKKKELAASVSTVGAKDLKDIPINSVGEALNGRLAGVTASTAEGSPDAEVRVRVRGGGSITQDNSPLYVIDGVIVESGLSNVVLQDIQDITVLKDAAATAIYGARGANGVIVISTKTGKIGKLKVTYNAFYGVKKLARTLDVLSPNEFIKYQYEREGGFASSTFTGNYVSTWDSVVNFSHYKTARPINWQKEVMGEVGNTVQQNIGFSGGTKKITYNFGYTFQDDKAIVRNSSFKRHQLNFKTEYKVTDKLKIGLSTRYVNQNVWGAGVSSESGSAYNRLRQSVKFRPYLLPGQSIDEVDPNDDNPGNNLSLINPIKLSDQEYRRKTTNGYNITASLSYTFNKHFSFKSTFGWDNNLVESRAYDDSITPFATIQNGRNPIISFDTLRRKSWVNSNTITYSLKNYKKKHDLEILLGQEARALNTLVGGHQSRNLQKFGNRDSLFNVFNTLTEQAGYPLLKKTRETNVSFFTRIGYTYNKKYIFNFVLRADGSSKFIDENKWGYFPSASVAWRLSNEKFFDKSKFLSKVFNDVKIRAGFGSNGNSRIDDYLFSTVFGLDPSRYYGLNQQVVNAWYSNQLANQKIKWESTVNRNLGIDLVFAKKRIELSVDYYYNTSKDLLLNANIAPTFGYATQIQNIGKTKNSGYEVQLNASILQRRTGLNWNANFNFSYNKGEIVELNNGLQSYLPPPSWGVSGQPSDYTVKVGESVGAIWGYVTDGFYKVSDFDYNSGSQTYTLKSGVVNNTVITPQPGTIKFKDLNGDGKIDPTDNDKQIIGRAAPKFSGGLNQQFTFKNFDASLFFNFAFGNDIYNANKIEFTNAYTPNSNLLAVMNNRWRTIDDNGITITDPTALAALNKDAGIWKPIPGSAGFFPHSWAIEDGSFVRLNNLTIGYSLPIKTLAKWRINRFRIYVTGNNLAVFTKYTGYDPEVSVRKSPLTPGLDYSAYPKSRSIIFGLNVNF